MLIIYLALENFRIKENEEFFTLYEVFPFFFRW